MATAAGDKDAVQQLAIDSHSDGKNNVSFLSNLVLGQLDECIDLLCETGRPAEAALLARTYKPSRVSQAVGAWREELSRTNKKAADSIADPADYPNLFPEFEESSALEKERDARAAPSGESGKNSSVPVSAAPVVEMPAKDDFDLDDDLGDLEDVDTSNVNLDDDDDDFLK